MLPCTVTQADVERIHEKTLELFARVGVLFERDDIIALFRAKGIRTEGHTVYFDAKAVDEAVASLCPSFTVKTPYASVKIGEGSCAFVTVGGVRDVLRADGRVEEPTVDDYIAGRKLDETSPVISLANAPFFRVGGLSAGDEARVKTALTLRYSTKPLVAFCNTLQAAEESIEIIRRFYGVEGGPFAVGIGNMISPLRYSVENLDTLLAYIKRGLPVVPTCCSMPGLTSPITLGGTIVQNNAEVLAGLILSQVVNPGTPVVYGNMTVASNMRLAAPATWGPEMAVIMQYAKAMADYYHVPNRVGGGLTDAKYVDWQAGAESAISLMSTLDCDTNVVFHACGELDGLNIFSFEKYMLDEELLEARLSLRNRDLFSDEAINLDSMEEVGCGGNYLLEDDTIALCRVEQFTPTLFTRDPYSAWKEAGKPTVMARAEDMLKKRFASYTQPQWTPEQDAMLRALLHE